MKQEFLKWQDLGALRVVFLVVAAGLVGASLAVAVGDGAFRAEVAPLGVSVQLGSGCEEAP